MRVLWLTADRSSRVAGIFDALRKAFVALEPDTRIVTHSRWSIESSPEGGHPYEPHLPTSWINEFDLVFTDALFAYQKIKWRKVAIPKCVLFEDVHRAARNGYLRNAGNEFEFTHFFVRYRDASVRMHPWLLDRPTFWLPHSIDRNIFYSSLPMFSYGRPIRILATGRSIPTTYPNRLEAHDDLSGMSGFLRIKRPEEKTEDPWPTGHDYADLLRASKISIGDGSVYEYPLLKSFEIPACGSILLMRHFREMTDLGFDGSTTSVDVNGFKSWKHAAMDLLSDEPLMSDISIAGASLIKEKHTANIRAIELRNVMRSILSLPYESENCLDAIS